MKDAAASELDGKKLVIATRLHLGKASSPPSDSKLKELLENFESISSKCRLTTIPVIAVDATPKIKGYDYVKAIREILGESSNVHILPGMSCETTVKTKQN
jgi:hypothetical protein